MTYIQVKKPYKNWIYLCTVKDLYHNQIIAYSFGVPNNLELIYDCLKQLEQLPLEAEAILYTDQGFQFTHPQYIKKVAKMKVIESMSRKGNCWDNACIENFFSYLNVEMPPLSSPQTLAKVKQFIIDYIHYYTSKRIQKIRHKSNKV